MLSALGSRKYLLERRKGKCSANRRDAVRNKDNKKSGMERQTADTALTNNSPRRNSNSGIRAASPQRVRPGCGEHRAELQAFQTYRRVAVRADPKLGPLSLDAVAEKRTITDVFPPKTFHLTSPCSQPTRKLFKPSASRTPCHESTHSNCSLMQASKSLSLAALLPSPSLPAYLACSLPICSHDIVVRNLLAGRFWTTGVHRFQETELLRRHRYTFAWRVKQGAHVDNRRM